MGSQSTEHKPSFFTGDTALLLYIALAKLLLHFIANLCTAYGYFRDELYYLTCSDHLAMGYPDHPPLSILILAANRALFGDSLFALRLLPALASAATVVLTGLIARELGGKRFAQVMAATGSFCSLVLIGMTNIFSMNAFDIFLWSAAVYIILRIMKTDNNHLWIVLGVVVGLGSLNKISMLWLGAGVAAGLLFTPNRKWLMTPWPWLCAGIAFFLFLPFIIWNFQHDFAHLEFMRRAASFKYASQNPLTLILDQFLLHNPFSALLWLAGLFFFFFSKEGKPFRIIGWLFLTPFILLVINWHSKAEYLAAAFAILFAAGGVMLERWFSKPSLRWLRCVYPALLVLSFCFFAPFALPILPVETLIRYTKAFGLEPPSVEGHQLSQLPQFYADMFGWEDKAKAVAGVYNKLSAEEKVKCAIFADNYGRCAAIDFFGKKYGLPKSIGQHNSYWIWGPREYTGELVIILGGDYEDQKRNFDKVEIAGVVSSPFCMPYENNLNIYVCRNLKISLNNCWPRLKSYI